MKKMCIILALICAPVLVFAGGGGDNWGFGLPIKGNGNMVTSEKPVTPFEGIKIQGSAAVYFHASQEYRAVVTIDSNLEEYVLLYTQNGTLNIGTKRGSNCLYTQYIVDVYCPGLTGISISGSARFEAKDKISVSSCKLQISGMGRMEGGFECKDFSIGVSGSGDISGQVVCTNFSADVSGSAKIVLSGSAKDMNISITGSGDFNGNELCANNAAVQISGSAVINIWALDTLKANVSGSGSVKYRGTPKIDYRGSGSGRLESV